MLLLLINQQLSENISASTIPYHRILIFLIFLLYQDYKKEIVVGISFLIDFFCPVDV